MKVELEEANKIEDILKQQLLEKKARCEALKEEIVKTRKKWKSLRDCITKICQVLKPQKD
jgi:hypothetical protein